MTQTRPVQATAPTEQRNPRTVDIDRLPTLDVLRLINAEDAQVAPAVGEVLPALAQAVDMAVASLIAGHRVHYFGAGTSGRIAVLDAAELGPTYALEPGRVVAHLAGGSAAVESAMEDVEDSAEEGAADAAEVAAGDIVLGVTASGRTPYVAGALQVSRAVGAYTVLVSANPDTPLGDQVSLHIGLRTGPEVIAGSTRMKAGTAQKLVLNSFSTAVMVQLGRTYSNLMFQVVATNEKLRGRLAGMLVQATGLPEATCAAALVDAEGDAKVALVALLAPASAAEARQALEAANGVIGDALRPSHGRQGT